MASSDFHTSTQVHKVRIVAVYIAIGVAAAILTVSVHADLLSADLPEAEGTDTFLTLDTNTGLEWLDIRLSTSTSYDSLVAGGPIGNFRSLRGRNPITEFARPFRHASLQELLTLYANAGITEVTSDATFSLEKYTAAAALIQLLGEWTECFSNDTELPCEMENVNGIYEPQFNTDYHYVSLLSTCLSDSSTICNSGTFNRAGPYQFGRADTELLLVRNDNVLPGTGHFQVRQTLDTECNGRKRTLNLHGFVHKLSCKKSSSLTVGNHVSG